MACLQRIIVQEAMSESEFSMNSYSKLYAQEKQGADVCSEKSYRYSESSKR